MGMDGGDGVGGTGSTIAHSHIISYLIMTALYNDKPDLYDDMTDLYDNDGFV